MATSSTTAAVRILPNNKVYRQLFDAQVQLSETYNRVRDRQLSAPAKIIKHPDATPLVKNIRPHESQKRQWLSSLPFANDPTINPIAIVFHDERKRRQNEEEQELEELRQEVFNLPDNIEREETKNEEDNGNNKENVTERLAATRQTKFNQLWKDLLDKISTLNQDLVKELEEITRECNIFYERGDQEIHDQLQTMIYQEEITTLTIQSFEQEFEQLDHFLPPRLSQIQDYCQSIENLESERIRKIRELFKYYSERLYKIHHLSDEDTAALLEKQVNELNTQIIENRKIYTELEARLLTGETARVHRYRAELIDHQNQWRDAMWIIHKQTWISKLSQCKAKLDSTIFSTCEPVGSNLAEQTRHFVEHVHRLNSFIPPISTKDNAHQWYKQGYDIVDTIVNTRQELMQEIRQIITDDIELLEKEWKTIRDRVLQTKVYNTEQVDIVFERDIEPLFEERKQFLQESIIDQAATYERLTNAMYAILDRLLTYIEPPAAQWDDHQIRLEHVTAQLVDMMRECRRPHDLQNEKKLTKLDATLDEMRSAANETALSRLLTSAYGQLDTIKTSYAQFYDIEHNIVNKYSDMIAEEVDRYKNEMLDYFHVREINTNNNDDENLLTNTHRQLYTTSVGGTIYEIEGHSSHESDLTQQVSTGADDESSTGEISTDVRTRLRSTSYDPDQPQTQTFLTEDSTSMIENEEIPFLKSFQIPSNLVQSIMFNLCRAFLDYYDQWLEETTQRSEAVMYSKHDELDKEMDFQMHLHEPRRIRIETDIHNVRAAELVMHDERVERHIHGVQETLEQTDADYRRMLNEFSKSILTYKDEIFGLEQIFVNATTSGRLLSLQDRLIKKRDRFMENVRISLRTFRKRFDDAMQYLRQANVKFRKSFKMFSDGGNFSRDEIEVYRRKLEKTANQIDKAETAILKEMERLEKTQLEEATKMMNQFQERFKNHMIDLHFIETSNRWISETQVKIKSEVAANNQQGQGFKKLVLKYRNQIDSIFHPNLDKQPSTLAEVRENFQQIILMSYERALYLKCLSNELSIPPALIPTLKNKGLLSEEELVSDLLNVTNADESSASRRTSRLSTGVGSHTDEAKSVKFASSSSAVTKASSRNKADSAIVLSLTGGQAEEINTISTIRTLLHKSEQPESDEIVEPGVPAALAINTRATVSASSSRSSQTKKSSVKSKKRSPSHKGSSTDESTPGLRRDRPSRAKTRDELYAFYCTFGEKKHSGEDFLSKIGNILRDSIEGLLTHAELYYKDKGSRPVTRPQALREKFDEYAQTMVDKLKNYEEQCRVYHEHSINEFREMLELIERTSSLMAKLELDEQIQQAEKVLNEMKQQFDTKVEKKVHEDQEEKSKNFEQLRPTFGHPARKNDLQEIDQREKLRQNELSQIITQLRTNTLEDIQTNAQATIEALATNAERLLILFDDILTADEITRTKIPPVKQPLEELIRRQQAGRPLEDIESTPILERKQGHWPGLLLLDDQSNRRRDSSKTTKKRPSVTSQRQKTSASIVTQKTTLPQIETIAQRDQVYQRYKEVFTKTLSEVETRCLAIIAELDRHRLHWLASIEKLQQLRTA